MNYIELPSRRNFPTKNLTRIHKDIRRTKALLVECSASVTRILKFKVWDYEINQKHFR